ncbi:MAG: hypothetical protein JNG84_07950 [Archangium sp.]|nr:hypothetical protein [Archangium sp.]
MGVFQRELTFRTMASPDAAIEAITREVRPGPLLQFDIPGKDGDVREFRGEVTGRRFRFVRRVQYRNSFAPVIDGQVVEGSSGTEISATFSVPTSLLLFVVAWTVIATTAGLMAIQQAILLPDATFAPLVMGIPVLGLGLSWLGFTVEAANSAKVLLALLPPAPVSPNG